MSAKIAIFLLLICTFVLPCPSPSQIVIRPRAEEETKIAVVDVQPASQAKSAQLAEYIETFNQVLWNDLSFSGFFTIAGKSFYPPKAIGRPEDVNYSSWEALPFPVSYLTIGTLDIVGGSLQADLRVMDMKGRTESFRQGITGNPDQIRAIAHRWADDIVYRLTAGTSRGIASTKIAFDSRRGNSREIYIMDYDGYNPQPFTRNNSINLFANWAPDNSKLAFVSFRTGKPEVNIYSYTDGSRIPFPIFNSLASTPAISPDGTEVAFVLRTPRGDSDLFVSQLDGSNRRNISNNPAAETSPTWAPSGRQIAFVSGRQTGVGQIFICDADGSNVRQIVKEGGDADSPSWSPDGKWIAFHWKPHMSTSYELFIAEVATGAVKQLTNATGSNECPTWAPDGRHIVFQSNRTGTYQLYIMLLDGTELRMITRQGNNRNASWSGYFRRETQK